MNTPKVSSPAFNGMTAEQAVRMVMEQGEVNLAGSVRVLADGGFKAKYGALFKTPTETRAEFERLGWSRVAAFQTRNPMHRSHEYLAKVAIEVCDGVLVHSLLGNLKPGDIPAAVQYSSHMEHPKILHDGITFDELGTVRREVPAHSLIGP